MPECPQPGAWARGEYFTRKCWKIGIFSRPYSHFLIFYLKRLYFFLIFVKIFPWPELALGQAIVGLILQQLHRLLHVGVRLLQCLSEAKFIIINLTCTFSSFWILPAYKSAHCSLVAHLLGLASGILNFLNEIQYINQVNYPPATFKNRSRAHKNIQNNVLQRKIIGIN